MPHARPRWHLQLGLIVILCVLSISLWLASAPPPGSPVLVVNTPDRVVLDLMVRPGDIEVTYAGAMVELPGKPTRWLAASLQDGVASVGWTDSAEAPPSVTFTLPDRGVRLVIYPLDDPAVAGLEVLPGLRPAPGRPALRIVKAR